jgi:hypothetical protein
MVDAESRVKQSEAALCRVLDDEAVLLNLDSGEYYSLNPLGVTVWRLCDGSASIRKMVEQVCAEYEVGTERAQADVLAFIGDLAAEGLVAVEGAAECT